MSDTPAPAEISAGGARNSGLGVIPLGTRRGSKVCHSGRRIRGRRSHLFRKDLPRMHLCRRPLGQAPQPIRNRSVPWRSLLAVAAGLALVATPLQPSAATPVATPEVSQL